MNTFPLFTKIRESAEQFEWIVVEACQEITDDTLLQMFWTNEYVNPEQYQLEIDLGEFGCIGVNTFFEPTYFFEDISSFMESFADEFDSGMTAEKFKEQIMESDASWCNYFFILYTELLKAKEQNVNYGETGENVIDFFERVIDWLSKYQPEYEEVSDLSAPENWGIAIRGGKQRLVVLDFGFNSDVSELY